MFSRNRRFSSLLLPCPPTPAHGRFFLTRTRTEVIVVVIMMMLVQANVVVNDVMAATTSSSSAATSGGGGTQPDTTSTITTPSALQQSSAMLRNNKKEEYHQEDEEEVQSSYRRMVEFPLPESSFTTSSESSFTTSSTSDHDDSQNNENEQVDDPDHHRHRRPESGPSTNKKKTKTTNRRKLEDFIVDDDASSTTDENAQDDDIYRVHPFVEGVSEYDEYQQAWRLLGFMIDCDDYGTDDDGGGGGGGSGSWDGGTGEGCQRYVLWAAYVDLEYEGGGIGEYQYWNRQQQVWDDTSCNYASNEGGGGGSGDKNNNNGNNGGNRCAKMDCHLDDTHWSLLGYFKHKSYDDWMEQLFKHEGICVWRGTEGDDSTYNFMNNARKTWPQGCSISETKTALGNPIYYDVKPTANGGITLGLYTDTRCLIEYQKSSWSDPITVENVLGNLLVEGGSGDHSGDNNNNNNNNNYYGDDFTLDDALGMWNDALSVFTICQPCVAYDISNYGYSADDDSMHGSNYGLYNYYGNDDYYYGNNNDGTSDFDCYDDADYTNVNQCMKFMAKTEMQTATFRDLTIATMQRTLVGTSGSGSGNSKSSSSTNTGGPLSSYVDDSKRRKYYRRTARGSFTTYFMFIISVMVFVYGAIQLYRVIYMKKKQHDTAQSEWTNKAMEYFNWNNTNTTTSTTNTKSKSKKQSKRTSSSPSRKDNNSKNNRKTTTSSSSPSSSSISDSSSSSNTEPLVS